MKCMKIKVNQINLNQFLVVVFLNKNTNSIIYDSVLTNKNEMNNGSYQ